MVAVNMPFHRVNRVLAAWAWTQGNPPAWPENWQKFI
jgi:hypothetical protein